MTRRLVGRFDAICSMVVVLPLPATDGIVTQFPDEMASITDCCSVDGRGKKFNAGGGFVGIVMMDEDMLLLLLLAS